MAATTSRITVRAEPSARRTRRSRPWREGGPGRWPVRHTLSAATPAWLAGTPGPYRSTSDADSGGTPPAGGPPGAAPPRGPTAGDPAGRYVTGSPAASGWLRTMMVGD